MLSQTTGNRWTAERTIEHGRLFGCSLPPQVHLQSIEEVFSDFDGRCCGAHGFS